MPLQNRENLPTPASGCLTPTLPLGLWPRRARAAGAPVARLAWGKPVLARRRLSLPGGRAGAQGCAGASPAVGRQCRAPSSPAGKGTANNPQQESEGLQGGSGNDTFEEPAHWERCRHPWVPRFPRAAVPSRKSPLLAQNKGSRRPQHRPRVRRLCRGSRSARCRRGSSPTPPAPATTPACRWRRRKSDTLGAGGGCHSKSPVIHPIPTENPDRFPVPGSCGVLGREVTAKPPPRSRRAAPAPPVRQTAAPVLALRGGHTPAFPSPNLITTCFLTNYNAQIIEELKASVAGRLVAVSFPLRWPHCNFTSFRWRL